MKTMFNKTIALFLTFVFVSTLFPYWGFAQSRPEPVPGSVKGYDRSVFDYHFSKADRELNPERWLSEARRGIGLAINAWEIFSTDLFDGSFTQDEAKKQLKKWSEEELEFRFTQWLTNRFFGAEIENTAGQLSVSVNDAHFRYTYHFDDDGNLLREETTGDPRIIRPSDEGRDFAADLAKWYEESQKNINELSGYFETSVFAIFPELLAYFTEDLHDSLLPLIGNAAGIAFSALQTEFENIVAREQRLFTSRRTGDIYSLRKKSELEEAGYIVSNLIDQATAVCDAGIAGLQTRIEAAAGGEGDLVLMGTEWLEMYREQFERGLKIWEEAEERFFIRRLEWEHDSQNLFDQGKETWKLAFDRLEEERNNWELQAKKLFDSGKEIFKNASVNLEAAIELARIEILNNLELRKQSGASRAGALVDMYFTCVSAVYAAIENGKFFIEYYDENSSADIANDSIYEWIETERSNLWILAEERYLLSAEYQQDKKTLEEKKKLVSRPFSSYKEEDYERDEAIFNEKHRVLFILQDVNAGKYTSEEKNNIRNELKNIINLNSMDWLDEIQKAANIYRSFYAKAMEMRDNLLNDYGNIFGDGALRDILGENVSTEDFVLDEYQIALIKAKVLVNYWEKRTDIAEAVHEYATEIGAGRMTEAESILQWEKAKAAYEESVSEYESEMNRLNEIGAKINDKTDILNDCLIKINNTAEELKRINDEYYIYIQTTNPNGIKIIEHEFEKKYEDLLEAYKLIFVKDGNNFYQKELELNAKIGLIWTNKEKEAFIEYLYNGYYDEEEKKYYPSYDDLKKAWEQILILGEFDPIPESAAECGINANDPRGILIDRLIQQGDEKNNKIIRGLCYAAKMEAYTALKTREMEINMLVAPDAGTEYGSAEWYSDAWGFVYSDVDLRERLLDDYVTTFEKLIEKRVAIEKDALTFIVDGIESNNNYSNLLANFCLVDKGDVEDGIKALNILSKRINNGENYVNEDGFYEDIIAWFISGGSFFLISEIFITEELYEYNLAEGLYNAYLDLKEYSEFIEREKRNEFQIVIKQFFDNYGIVTEGIKLPKIEDICPAVFKYKDKNQEKPDYVWNVAVFLKGIDEIFLDMPLFLKEEIYEWKDCFIDYFATLFYSEVPTTNLTNELSDEEENLKRRNDVFDEMFAANISNDIKTMKYFSDLYSKIAADETILYFKKILFSTLNNTKKYFNESTIKEWWEYLDNNGLPDVEVITEGAEVGMIELKAWANFADFRINYTLKAMTDGFHGIENEDIKKLIEDYMTEVEDNKKHLQKLQKLKMEFAIAGQNCEYAAIQRGDLEEELLGFQAEVDNLNILYQEAMKEYLDASSDLAETAELYDLQYSKTKTAYSNVEDTRNEYEKQDAIRRWASTAYLDTDINDTAYCREKLDKANIVLDILSDLYSDSDETRPYINADYERLYSEYKKSIQDKIIADKMLNLFNADFIDKINNRENTYNLFIKAVNELGKPFVYSDDYASSQDKGKWTIQDVIRLRDGKLLFNRDNNFAITVISYNKINEIKNYFDVTDIKEGQHHETTAFQEEVRNLSIRMAGYFKKESKMTQWGLARDYLLRQLADSNVGIDFLGNIRTKSVQLGENGTLGILEYQLFGGSLGKNPKIADLVKKQRYVFHDKQNIAYWALSPQERDDLEFYIILTLTNDSSYNYGFESFTAVNELQYAYNVVNNLYDIAADKMEWWRFGYYKHMYGVNKLAKDKIGETLVGEKQEVEKWKTGIKSNISNINSYYTQYIESCESINALQTGVFGEKGVSWSDIEKTVKGLNAFSEEELKTFETLWKKMEQAKGSKYTGIIDGIVGLAEWIGDKREKDGKALEKQWENDDKERGKNESTYYEKIEAFLDGKVDKNDLRVAMEDAFGNETAAWKKHFYNLGQAILDTLGEYHLYGPDYRNGFTSLKEEYSALVGTTFGIGLMAELAAREAEWNQQRIDIAEKAKTWTETSKLIFEKGKEEWNIGIKKMDDSYLLWTEKFMTEYDSVSILWDEAKLAGLEDKEKWLERAAEAADNALTGAMISAIGSDAEMFSRKMDTRDFIGISVPNASLETENILANLLNSTSITGMSDAFNTVNNLANLSNFTIRRGINRTGIWDDTNARIEAAALAQEANKAIAERESKRLAATVKKAAENAIEMLADRIKSANESFSSSMDNTFMLQGQWKKSNGRYFKDIVAGSTLFEPVLYSRKVVDGYIDYDIGPISLETRMDDEFLEGLESFAIQALIYKVQNEVSVIASGIFGDGKRIEIKKQTQQVNFISQGTTDENGKYVPPVWEIITINLESQYQGSGKFGEYIGHKPSVREKPGTTKDKIFYDEGEGELGRLLTEYTYWQVIESIGLAEISLAPWDKRMWDDRDSFFESPSLRSMSDFVLQVGVTVLSIAGTIVTCGAGAGSIVGAIALIAAINSADDLTFAVLDSAFDYKDWKEAGFEFGKALLQNTASAAASVVFSGVSGVTEGFFKGGLNGAVANAFTSPVGKVVAQTAMAGVQTFTTGTVSNIISGITYDKDVGLGYNSSIFHQGMEGTFKNVLTSMTSSLVTGSLQAINSGMDMEKLVGFNNEMNKKGLQTLNNTLGGLAGQGINYAMGGDFTLNVLNTAILDLMGLKNTNTGNSGLLELHIGRDGTKMNFGTGGADVSPSSIIYSMMGAMVWDVNNKIDKYTKKSDFDAKVTLRAQYGFGDKEQKGQLWEIFKGKTEIRVGTGEGAETVIINGKRVVMINDYRKGMSVEEQMRLAAILGQEAHRDGYKEGDIKNGNIVTAMDSLNEFREASIARITMGDRINHDYQWFYDLNMDFELESYMLIDANASGNFELFYDYLDFAYINERDYFFPWVSTGGDFQNSDPFIDIPLFKSNSRQRVNEINAQRLQAAFENYKTSLGDEVELNNDALWADFQQSEQLQTQYGYEALKFNSIYSVGCTFLSTKYALEAITGERLDTLSLHQYITENKLYEASADLPKEAIVNVMNSVSEGAFNVEHVFRGTTLSLFDLLNYEQSSEQYIAHLRVQQKGVDDIHSVMLSSIEYLYNSNGIPIGINNIYVANPLSGYSGFYSKISYKPNEIIRWDIFRVTHFSNNGTTTYPRPAGPEFPRFNPLTGTADWLAFFSTQFRR